MTSKFKHNLARATWLYTLTMLTVACGSRVDTQDSQTHWLSCKKDAECGSGRSCVDRVCVETEPTLDAGSEGSTSTSSPSTSTPTTPSSPGDSDAAPPSCASRALSECEESGCALIFGIDQSGDQGAYGCQDADRSCPPVVTCALDPQDPNHAVEFGGCVPEGWLPDRSEPNACADVVLPQCEERNEAECATGPACHGIYGKKLDGSYQFAGCVISGLTAGDALTCATDGEGGAPLLFSTTLIPEDWVTETSLTACQPECYSPWRNTDRIGEADLRGCPCDTPGDVCLEGQGLTCEDVTDDVQFNAYWTVSDAPCETELTCSGGERLQDCLERYEVCSESGSIVLDEGTVLYCGDTPLDCAVRKEGACTGDCFPYRGQRPGSNTGEFISCGATECTASRTVCATDVNGNWVNFLGCLPPGWTEVDAAVCEG